MARGLKPHIIVKRDKIAVSFPFNLTLKDELKKAIPYHERTWDPPTKYWLLSANEKNFKIAKDLLSTFFDDNYVVLNETGHPQISFGKAIDDSSLYSILEVGEDASQQEIKRAYRNAVKHVHPDRTQDPNDAEYFHLIQRAYETLKDPEKRKSYDFARSVLYDQGAVKAKARTKQPPKRHRDVKPEPEDEDPFHQRPFQFSGTT